MIDDVLSGKTEFLPSEENLGHLLGPGYYFYESADHAEAHAREQLVKPRLSRLTPRLTITDPEVLCAIVDLSDSLDLTLNSTVDSLAKLVGVWNEHYEKLGHAKGGRPTNSQPRKMRIYDNGGSLTLANRNDSEVVSQPKLIRGLDGEFLDFAIELWAQHGVNYSSIRTAFQYGPSVIPNSEIRRHNKIQVCVRNRERILKFITREQAANFVSQSQHVLESWTGRSPRTLQDVGSNRPV